MKRWLKKERIEGEAPDIDAFIEEIAAVCVRHGLSISHEDGHGAFEITEYCKHTVDWLRDAHDARQRRRPRVHGGNLLRPHSTKAIKEIRQGKIAR